MKRTNMLNKKFLVPVLSCAAVIAAILILTAIHSGSTGSASGAVGNDGAGDKTTVRETTAASPASTQVTTMPAETGPRSASTADGASLFTIGGDYSSAGPFNADGYAAIEYDPDGKGMKAAVIDAAGNVVFGPVDAIYSDPYYDNGELPCDTYIGYCEDGKWGFVNAGFATVIEPQYEEIQNFAPNGLCGVKAGGVWGVIDRGNNAVIPFSCTAVGNGYGNGRIAVGIDGKFALYTTSGQQLLTTGSEFYSTRYSEETGLVRTCTNGHYGLTDESGKTVLSADYTYITFPGDPSDEGLPVWDAGQTGLIMVATGEFYAHLGLVNRQGTVVYAPKSEEGIEFSSGGLAMVRVNGLCGYINSSGDTVIAPQFLWAEKFNDSHLARVGLINGETVYIDEKGTAVDVSGSRYFDTLTYNGQGIAYGEFAGITGLYDRTGTCVFDSQGQSLDRYWYFINGLYQFSYTDKTVYTDSFGQTLNAMPAGTYSAFPVYSTFLIESNGKKGMIDAVGNELIPPVYDEIYGDPGSSPDDGIVFINESDSGLLMTRVNGEDGKPLYGILSCSGKEILPPVSDRPLCVSANGMVPLELNGKWGYVYADIGVLGYED